MPRRPQRSSSPPEEVPLQELIHPANPEEDANVSDDGEAQDDLPIMEDGANYSRLYGNIRHAVHVVLDFTPMAASARANLKARWFGVFLSMILFVVLAAVLATVLITISGRVEPTPKDDLFSNWAKGMGPNDRTALRLPRSLKPLDYRLHFFFHMDDRIERFHYEGRLAIMAEVQNNPDNDKFLIHAHKSLDVDLKNFIISDYNGYVEHLSDQWDSFPYINSEGILAPANNKLYSELIKSSLKLQDLHRYQVPNVTRLDDDTLEVEIIEPLDKYSHIYILIHFNGTMRTNPPGIFTKKVENSDDYWVATQFTPSLARVAFPSFDEPGFWATYSVSIAHPKRYIALSNAKTFGEPRPARRLGYLDTVWTTFHPSRPMPSYLFGFVVGPFKSLQLNTTRYTSPRIEMFALNQQDLISRSIFAANVTVRAIDFAKEYFSKEYPLYKLFMAILPTRQPIDSECWGLILFREETVYLDFSTASVDMLEKVARSVVHYIIHQWVGNIVGPAWWDDLWATEALIAYIENEFLDKIFPDWKIKEKFGTQVIGEALNVDVLQQAHSVAALPRIPYYPITMFDALTSVKGAALFRMMDLYTPGSVMHGVRQYLIQRSGHAVNSNLIFQHLHNKVYPKNATKEESPSTVRVMDKWTRDVGYPLVTIKRYAKTADMSLFQETFDPLNMIGRPSLDSHEIPRHECDHGRRHLRSNASTTAWSLPIDLWEADNSTTMVQLERFWMTTDYHRVCGGIPARSKFLIVNYDQKGFFRVNYEEGNWNLIGHEMIHDPRKFSKITRAQLIDDAITMAKVGRLNFTSALQMPLALMHQGTMGELTAADVGMYERAMRAVADIHDCLRGSLLQGPMQEYMRLLASAQWAAVDPPRRRKQEKLYARNDILKQRTSILLQEQAIFWACYTGMNDCTDWSVTVVKEWQEFHPGHEYALEERYTNTYCAAVKFGPDSFFDFLWSRYNQQGLSEKHKQEILWSLLCTKNAKKIMEVFEEMPGRQLLVDDTMRLWSKMQGRPISAWYAFKYERSTWDNVHHRMYNSSFFTQIIVAITSALSTPADLEEIQQFRITHNQQLWDIQELLEDNVHNIRSRLHFRSIIEQSLYKALEELLPLAKALKFRIDFEKSHPLSPAVAYTTPPIPEPATPHQPKPHKHPPGELDIPYPPYPL